MAVLADALVRKFTWDRCSSAFAAVMTGGERNRPLVDVNQKLAQAKAEGILHAVPYARLDF